MSQTAQLQTQIDRVHAWPGLPTSGRVHQVVGLLIESTGPAVHLGEICWVYTKGGERIPCEVVGFRGKRVLLMALGEMSEIAPGSEVYPSGEVHQIPVCMGMVGRVVDALGNPIDGKGPLLPTAYYSVQAAPPDALRRQRIKQPLTTGVRAIDAICTTGKGQRIGIFAGSGVGKSTLMGMIAKMSEADVNVIALIGERGREVREFIERELGDEGLRRSVVVVATSDQAALQRAKGASVATGIAEFFRDQGLNVVLMMDSVTRYAMALREIGLAAGEPPTTKGYTPSVFAQLPKLLERAGNGSRGSITGIYTILVEGDDMNDPVADTARSILDGHIVLSRTLAAANHFPAIDVLGSLSRVMPDVTDREHIQAAGEFRNLMQAYREAEDLINIGAYVNGSNPKIDRAIAHHESIVDFLRQDCHAPSNYDDTLNRLKSIISS